MGTASEIEGLRRMAKVVNYLLSRTDSGPFREPVDFRGLGLWDYPKIIDKMMDLGTVKRNLERKQYQNAKECAQDIRQIWVNCKTYNADESDFYQLADNFSKKFEERYAKIQRECDTGDNEGQQSVDKEKETAASLDVKAKFAKRLYRLSGMELGHILNVLDMRCPQALEQPGPCSEPGSDGFNDKSELEINVDAIDTKTFAELDKYVREKMKARSNSFSENVEEQGSARKKQKR